ncbi:ABC sugar (glycerol) transporter extracellular solute-binding protein, family 1 [Shewanella halifaxensis HAW-EB4]|uniref:ABC sugar (Glycerol) transporter extracellular solute-binding protein, family 1 n=1 Tax=Shewanella halifaxensis (strain HAW-EB4) TaxID=458817 RepID=B0TRJ9_SHEHH|nr:ABC transporter substrate-binding protein [Shewanella halifaxensis]ABZ76417.1 ABC sugar (glycerol) transporter extracellular solute-binding protein, family 1 [Shewanella halifaxensis HAW-EB4]
MLNQLVLRLSICCILLSADIAAASTFERAAEDWITHEFQSSTLTKNEQRQEMLWFINAAKPYRNLTIRVTSERIPTHIYESEVLAKAFYEITGIYVVHEVTGEGDVLHKMSIQNSTEQNLYDAYISDSDLIGTHFRQDYVVPLSDFITGSGKNVTSPTLDLEDFIGLSFTASPDGKLYQLPDQQFVNLYWYRKDWFSKPELKNLFRTLYGYELAVPQNWQAYEDIAEFFSDKVKEIDGKRIYGHMDYAKKHPSLGWRISDAWLSMAGVGDKGLPNGTPVDEWGIRVEDCHPVGASTSRGGALNSPAAVYAVEKYVDWLKYAPPESRNLYFSQSLGWAAKGVIAQQIFWYSADIENLVTPGSVLLNEDGTPKWRVAPSPVGKYWQDGMKSGYQDAGAWTFLKSTPLERRQAAWLYAQFVVSKTVSLKKFLKGYTPVRLSDLQSEQVSELAPYLGGLIEFYRSRGRQVWTPTGNNVPDYPGIAKYWWQHIAMIVEGDKSAQQALDQMAQVVDEHLASLEQSDMQRCAPKLNPITSIEAWLENPGSPKMQNDEKPKGRTLPYEEAIRVWQ